MKLSKEQKDAIEETERHLDWLNPLIDEALASPMTREDAIRTLVGAMACVSGWDEAKARELLYTNLNTIDAIHRGEMPE